MPPERKLFELLKEFSVFAGELALPYYGKIETQYKKIQIAETLHESPVTVIDHGIQEMLLSELVRKGFTDVAFNGEEETHLKFFFRSDYQNGITVHCDPIDGTHSFASGKNRFCTGYGLSRARNGKHEFFCTVVYSPLEKKLFWSFENEMSRHSKNSDAPRTFVGKRVLNREGTQKILSLGYSVVNPGNAHLGIIDVALGNSGAFFHYPIEVHDALIPFSFAKNYGVLPTDEKGNAIKAVDLRHTKNGFSRIPKIFYFANDEIRDELIPILSNPKYII